MHKQHSNVCARAVSRSYLLIALALIAALAVANSDLLHRVLAATRQQTISVTPSFSEGQSVASSEPIELQLSRPVERSEGRIAVLIGASDLTSLFTQSGIKLTYNAKIFPLPLGESALTVYLISTSEQ